MREPPSDARAELPEAIARLAWPFAALLFAIAHADALFAGFGADDFLWLELARPESVLASFTSSWGHGEAWRPLARVSFFIDWLAFGVAPGGWHAVNLALHAGVAIAFFALTRRISGDARLAAFAALLFSLTPTTTENSIWISGRTHTLAALCGLAALLALDRALLNKSLRAAFAAAAATALAMLSYEAAASLAAFACALGWLRTHQGQCTARGAVAPVGGVVAVIVALLVVRSALLPALGLYPTFDLSSLLSLAFAAHVAGFLLTPWVAFFPPWWLLVIGAAFCGDRQTARRAAAGVVCALLAAAPFLIVDGFGLRFTYGASMGLALLLSACVVAIFDHGRVGQIVAGLCAAALLASGVLGVRANAADWRTAWRIGETTLASLAAVLEERDRSAPLVVLDPLRSVGSAFLFYNHFDSALRVFDENASGFIVTDRELSHPDPQTRVRELAALVDAYSAERGDAFCPALSRAFTAGAQGAALAEPLLDCGATLVVMTRVGGRAVRFDGDSAAARRALRGWYAQLASAR